MRRGDLLVTLLQLHAGDDHLPLFRPQPLQRRFISIHGLVPDRFFERRRRRIRMLRFVVHSRRRRVPRHPPHLVADPVDQRLAQVRLQRTIVARLEVIDVPERLGERLLHQVFGVAEVAGPSRQTPTRPAPQGALVPPNQIVEGLIVALPGATQQIRRRGQIGHDGRNQREAMTRAENCRHGPK